MPQTIIKNVSVNLISPKEIQNKKRIIHGVRADIYTALYNEKAVVIKTTWPDRHTNKDAALRAHEFEVSLLSQFQHPNILTCYGSLIATKTEGHSCVLEYMISGDLYLYLENQSYFGARTRHQHVRRQIEKDILKGLAYIHSQNVVHRDIKPENILLNETRSGMVAKIADFELARKFDKDKNYYTTHWACGTTQYFAREIALFELKHNEGDIQYTAAVDMWAFGFVSNALNNDFFYQPFHLYEYPVEIEQAILRRDFPSFQPGTPRATIKRINWCWKDKPEERPTAQQLLDDIDAEERAAELARQNNNCTIV